MSILQHHEFNLYPSFGMLAFFDAEAYEDSEELQGITEQVSREEVRTRIKAVPFCAVLHTARQGYSSVVIEFHEEEPALELASWDHVTECALDLPCGRLFIEAGLGGEAECVCLETEPNHYRFRACHAKIASIGFLPSEGDDHYLVQLWPSEKVELAVLKQYIQK